MFAVAGEVLGAGGIIAAAIVALIGTIAATRSSARSGERDSLDLKLTALAEARAEDRAYVAGQLKELREAHHDCLDREERLRSTVMKLEVRIHQLELGR